MKIPKCKIGKYHKWKGSSIKFGECGICIKCGYDRFDNKYRMLN